MYMYMCVYICLHTHSEVANGFEHVGRFYTYIPINTYIFTCTYILIYNIHTYMYISIHIYTCTFILYIYKHICIHTHSEVANGFEHLGKCLSPEEVQVLVLCRTYQYCNTYQSCRPHESRRTYESDHTYESCLTYESCHT